MPMPMVELDRAAPRTHEKENAQRLTAFLALLPLLLRTGLAAELAGERAEALALLLLLLRADTFLAPDVGVRFWTWVCTRRLEPLLAAPLLRRTGRYSTTCWPVLKAALTRRPFQSATLAALILYQLLGIGRRA